MRRHQFTLCGVSAMALAIAAPAAIAQTQLPGIDIGKAKPAKYSGKSRVAGKARPSGGPRSGPSGGGRGGVAGAGGGPGSSGGEGTGSGAGPAGYGGQGPTQDPYNKSYTLGDSNVGTRTNTPVMETPLNVQSISQQVLQDQQVTDLAQALRNVSGVLPSHGSADNGNPYDNITIRGFRAGNLYRDGFRIGQAQGFGSGYSSVQFADVASVEILKGPGGTLYGLSEPGGILNYVTKQPLDSPYYAANTQFGSLAQYRTTVDATGPLNADKSLLYRVDMSYETDGAPFLSQVDNVHAQSTYIRPIVKWIVDNDTWVKAEAFYNHSVVGSFWPSDPLINGQFVNLPRNFNYDQSSPNDTRSVFAALTWSHKFDADWSITQQIAYFQSQTDATSRLGTVVGGTTGYPFFDISGTTLAFPTLQRGSTFGAINAQSYSTNVAVNGRVETGPITHTLLVGGEFYKSLYDYQNWGGGDGITSPIGVFNPAQPGLPFLPPLIAFTESTQPTDDGGLYVQDQMKLPHDLFLTTGVRYQYYRQGGGMSGWPSFANSFETGATNYNLPQTADTQQAVTPRFGLLWRPMQWLSGYIHYAEGFSANNAFAYPLRLLPPSSAREAEAGVKVELLDGKLRGTASLYNLTKTNVPTQDTDPAHVCAGQPCSVAIGAVRSKGVELDVQGEIYPGWSIVLNYTNMDSIVTKAAPGAVNVSVGQPQPLTPRNVANLWSTYEFKEGALQGLKLGAGYQYTGAARMYDGTGLGLGWLTPSIAGYGVVNLVADYSYFVGDNKVNLGLNVTNLLDRNYFTAATFTSVSTWGMGLRQYGSPFSIMGHLGVELPGKPSKAYTAPSAYLPAQADWTGYYVGGQIGVAFGDNAGSFSYVTPEPYFGTQSTSADARGVLFGAHAGYNRQFDKWVVGLEGSVDGTDLSKYTPLGWNNSASLFNGGCASFTYPCLAAGYGGSIETKISSDVQGAVRARFGYAWNRLLFFGAGGVALANFNHQTTLAGMMPDPNPANPVGAIFYYASGKDSSSLRVGWTLGGGLEYAINSNWSVRADYRYTDFGSIAEQAVMSSDGAEWFKSERHVAQNQLQFGFSYRFAAPDPEGPPAGLVVKGPAAGGAPKSVAQSSPAQPFVSWTGFYLGGHVGYLYGDNHGSYNYEAPGVAGTLPFSGALIGEAQGVTVGAHGGYNHEFNKWVVGVEGEVDGTNLIRRNQLELDDPVLNGGQGSGVGALSSMIQSDVQGSVRARAGYSFDRLLPFVTGGVAIAHFAQQSQLGALDTDPNTGNQLFSYATKGLQSSTRVGWTAGGGAQWAINDKWSIRGEYRYADFGKLSDEPTTSAILGAYYSGSRHLDQNQVLFGFDYKFGSPVPPIQAKF